MERHFPPVSGDLVRDNGREAGEEFWVSLVQLRHGSLGSMFQDGWQLMLWFPRILQQQQQQQQRQRR